MKKSLFFVSLTLVLWSCQQKEQPLFKLLSPNRTGVEFNNTIIEDENYNILDVYYLYNGGGISIGDFDQNGLPDLFFTGNMVENKLYLNQGNFKFEDISETAGIGALGKWSYGSSVVDINGDGLPDIYVCSSISANPKERENMLFINQGLNAQGIPTFRDEAGAYGLDLDNHNTHASFFDYDQDGDLDVYVLANLRIEGIPTTYQKKVTDGSSPNNDHLYRNNGDGTFTEVTLEAGIKTEGFGLGVATADINKDGAVDIYVSNDFLTNDLLYLNQNGQFTEQIDEAMKHQSRFAMGNDAADINNDGELDIITLDMQPETNLRKKTVMIPNGYVVYINDYRYGYTHQYVRNMLQINQGNMKFSEIGQLAGVHQTEWSWSPLFADVDNDGYKDLLVTNGYPKDITDLDFVNFRMESGAYTPKERLLEQIPSVKIPNYVFKNNGDLTFEDHSDQWGFTQPSFSNGAAYADLDNDGDLDYVVNNINDPAFIYENTLNDGAKVGNNYLRLNLKGTEENPSALGARITLEYDGGKMQYQEQSIYRGYVSTVEDIIHFGLGQAQKADRIEVIWPNGQRSIVEEVSANQVLQLDISDAQSFEAEANQATDKSSFLTEVTQERKLSFQHPENDFIDYNYQGGLPHKFSQYGPSLSAGDINGDGLDDLFIGGAKNYQPSHFLQNPNGTFQLIEGKQDPDKQEEDMGSLLFDADGDGDNDLYVVSGSFEQFEGSPYFRDRLYFNDGQGNFTVDSTALPDLRSSGSCVRGADFDGDGDLDLFVGGRVRMGSYPFPPKSYILRNEGGTFTDATADLAPFLSDLGMVTDAIWSDYDLDNDLDLLVVGEWMPITILQNNDGDFTKVEAPGLNKTGFWNSIISGDFDKDGDPDYVIGNLGTNNFYCATPETPVSIVAKDFDNNGDVDAIMSCYFKAEDGSMQPFPIPAWKQLGGLSPIFRNRFDSYEAYGQTTINELLTPEEQEGALKIEADHLHSSYVENLGDGSFKVHLLPLPAQIAPVNGLVATDINGDTELDIVLVGNDYGNEVNMGQYDALIGLALLGDGQGHFEALSAAEAGFLVDGDAKAMVQIAGANGSEILLASQNRGPLKAYTPGLDKKVVKTQPSDCKAILHYADGRKEYRDIPYGSGFLSQSSRNLFLAPEVEKLEIIDFAGVSREVELE
ncbi:MAG TPA: VCBS repeat-containing protein [Saprospiraceae bacterium]|nr:VCBS repeat-containing protein [Saprospiraceae bacterium]